MQLNLETLDRPTMVLEANKEAPVRYCLYARKSTEQDELQALSIDSQIKEMMEMANNENLNIVEIRKESHSAKDSGQRPVFTQLLTDIRQGIFTGIMCWAPDRLSRNAGDLGSVVDLIDQGFLKEIRTHGQRFTNNPNEKFLLMILGSQAKLENDHKGENVKRGLRAKCEQGWRPGVSPIGYLHDKYLDKGQKKIFLDPERAPIIKQMFEKIAYEDKSGREIWKWLQDINFKTRKGKRLTLSSVYYLLNDPFYYGEFEYPVKSGKWYKGSYDALISKETYQLCRQKLTVQPKRHPGTIEFSFTQLMFCGVCGSGISAEEKFKKLKNGTTQRYVYYHCCKGRDRLCREKPIREEELLVQLLGIVDKLDIDQITIENQIRKEVERCRKFAYGVLGQESDIKTGSIEIDTRNYLRFILTRGSKDEKRELLKCLRSRLELRGQEVRLRVGQP